MRMLRRVGGLLGGRSTAVSSLVPLLAVSVLAALLIGQSSVTSAYPAFQSPQSPVEPPPPTYAPEEVEPGPPEEPSVLPPGETPEQPPTPPAAPEGSPPDQRPEEAVPQATPSEGESEREATAGPSEGEAPSSPGARLSWAVLIDTCVVGLSSVWLCCGGLVLVVFVLLVIASFLLRVT